MHTQSQLKFLFLFIIILSVPVSNIEGNKTSTIPSNGENPFTAKASLIRYWNRKIPNNLPKPYFLLSKASPLNAVQLAIITELLNQNSLSSHLSTFCSLANLLCFSETSSSDSRNGHFAKYSSKNFTNYGTNQHGGLNSFKNYSDTVNVSVNSFGLYSHGSNTHNEEFTNYAPNGNVVDGSFATYDSSAIRGTSQFKNYDSGTNVPNLQFTSYSLNGTWRKESFSSYSQDTNTGIQSFMNYGKNAKGNGNPNEFSNYAKSSNTLQSKFTFYGEGAKDANDSFTSYGLDSNIPSNKFISYGSGGNAATESFASYRTQANTGDDSFQFYVKSSNSSKANFANYGKTFNGGSDLFKGYGKESLRQQIGFQVYGLDATFKDYNKNGTKFSGYTNRSVPQSGGFVNKWVEPGKFFRESNLKEGSSMTMPDIGDKMPKRSFLPRSISSKLPFSSQLKKMFHASENSSMARMIDNTIQECKLEPSRGELKQCVASVEEMIDFAVSVLGRNMVVRSTVSVNGSKENIMIGSVKGINGGKVTKSVSCHQSLFPYLVYYCHSVPKVRVYEVDILDEKSREKINNGVAICHLDTSAWSPGHGAFVALGSSPGHIEVCHWIFENDMTWTTAD